MSGGLWGGKNAPDSGIYDALEDTVVGGRVILRKGGPDGEIESVVLIKDSHPVRDEQGRAKFLLWFQNLMAE